jgi:propane monooxygenase small subunit
MLASDETHAEANRSVMQAWLDAWVPVSVRAARELQPIWSQPHEKVVTFAESWDAAVDGFNTLVSDLHLSVPKGLAQ